MADTGAEVAAAATGIRLSAEALTIGVKESVALAAIAVPDGSTLPAVAWRSDNEKYVRVDANGVVTGVKKGNAVVYARIEGGAEVACAVTVLKGPRKLNISASKLTLGAEGMTAQLTFTMPAGVASNSFAWSTSNPNVAVVDQNGVVTTVGPGKANIMIKAYNGKGGKCKVTVLAAPTGIAFPTATTAVALGQTRKLEPTVTFASKKNRAEASVVFGISPASADPGCIALNPATGEITGVRKGSAIVIATTYNGKSTYITVNVAAAPTAISLAPEAVTLAVGEAFVPVANLSLPAGETDVASALEWSTSKPKIATVDANGVVTPKKRGSCVITATTVTGLKASCNITVMKAPGKVTISPASGTLYVGETGQFKVVFPKKTGGSYTIVSSDPSVATVDANGVVTALQSGTVTITVTTFNNKTATARLTVSSQPSSADVSLPDNQYSSITSTTSAIGENANNAEKLEYVIYCAQTQLGKPYIYGSGYWSTNAANYQNPPGFDCSGLVYWAFQHIGIKLQDTSHSQGYDGTYPQIALGDLRRGDIVCFNTVEDGRNDLVDHTGIYLGNGYFIHASTGSSKKVVVSEISTKSGYDYYYRNFSWGRRILN